MTKFFKKTALMAALLIYTAGTASVPARATSVPAGSSQAVSSQADFESVRGTEVTFYGWDGSEKTNAWIDGYLAKAMEEKYGIKLKRVGMDIDQILSQLLSEKTAGLEKGKIDVIWINGENFYTARKEGLLAG